MKPEYAARSAALSARAERLHLAEFWNVLRGGAVNQEPRPACAPHIWRYKEVIPQLHEAADLVPVEEAERRAVVFKNPALGGRIATTHTMYAAYSLYNPGERAMEAVLAPAPGNYLYFVARGDRRHAFAATYTEHLENIKKMPR